MIKVFLIFNELGTCVEYGNKNSLRFGVERIEHEIMKLVCGVCIRVQARWDINRSMTVRYVNKIEINTRHYKIRTSLISLQMKFLLRQTFKEKYLYSNSNPLKINPWEKPFTEPFIWNILIKRTRYIFMITGMNQMDLPGATRKRSKYRTDLASETA